MWIVFESPSCHGQNVTEVGGETIALRCSACEWERPVAEEHRAASEPADCVVCGCGDLWRQKDFPQRLGILMVGTGALVSTIFWWYMMPALSRLVEALLSAAWGQAVCAGWTGFGDRLLGGRQMF